MQVLARVRARAGLPSSRMCPAIKGRCMRMGGPCLFLSRADFRLRHRLPVRRVPALSSMCHQGGNVISRVVASMGSSGEARS